MLIGAQIILSYERKGLSPLVSLDDLVRHLKGILETHPNADVSLIKLTSGGTGAEIHIDAYEE